MLKILNPILVGECFRDGVRKCMTARIYITLSLSHTLPILTPRNQDFQDSTFGNIFPSPKFAEAFNAETLPSVRAPAVGTAV